MLTVPDIKGAVAREASGLDIARVYLFGSYARGEATDASDVDLCLETGPAFSLFNAGSFASALECSLGVPVEMATERSLFPQVRESMLRERVLVYER